MQTIKEFVEKIAKTLNIVVPGSWQASKEADVARRFLDGLNRYFYQTRKDIGTTNIDGEEFQYFSEFHKYWEASHKEILDLKVSKEQTKKAAKALQEAVARFGDSLLKPAITTLGLSIEDMAQVRFFTANQDFRKPPKQQFEKYLQDKEHFEPRTISEDPARFLKFMGFDRLSQTDKRLDFAKNAADFLVSKGIRAYDIAKFCENDALKIKETLIATSNLGYGPKKSNMFIRDMIAWNVWPTLKRIDAIDVASDTNTMKLALRTQILSSAIPFLSSFLDIFCYQYGHVDQMSAYAWRKVWEEWTALPGSNAPPSPCLFDFIIYRIGKDYCRDMLVRYECENGHQFYYFYARKQICPECRGKIRPIERLLPCQVELSQLPWEKGKLLLPEHNLLYGFAGKCIFDEVCGPRHESFIRFDPPKSISIKGETGWTSGYAIEGIGGGGLMA